MLQGAGEPGHLLHLEPLDLALELHVDLAHLPHLFIHPTANVSHDNGTLTCGFEQQY